jgi:rhamnogalacturonan endolyase
MLRGWRKSVRSSQRARTPSFERLEPRQLLAITTFTPVADTYIRPDTGAGSSSVLDALDQPGSSPGDRIVYIRFDLSGVDLSNIESATLTLSKIAGTRNDTIVSDRFDVYGLTNAAGLTPQTWDESTLTAGNVGTEYTNTGGNGLDSSQLFNLNQETGASVTESVNNSAVPQRLTGPALLAFLSQRIDDNGFVTFITEVDANHTDPRGWGYGSRENTATLRPTLELNDGEPVEPPPDPYPENPIVLPRQVENLNRGIVAVRSTASEVYVGWRLLGNDVPNIAFNLYRSEAGGPAVLLNGVPLIQTTDFVDLTANLAVANEYFVRPIINGVESSPSESFVLAVNSPVQQYLDIPLQRPLGGQTPDGVNYTYSPNDASVGDLDGDGDYEIVLKWDPSNSKDNSQPDPGTGNPGYTGNVYVDAYTLDGEFLWRIDLGINIRAGAHYTQFLVYDFDGDGRSEVVMKTAPGTEDGVGANVLLPGDDPNADFRNTEGRILTGPEYLTVFDGATGAALSTIPFSPPRGSVGSWGDTYGNRVDRFLATVAYLDGNRPSIVMARGYYAKTRLTAYDWRNGQLTERWAFDSTTPGNAIYAGQGNHNLSVADVDGDGKDEIVYGAMVLDDNGQGLYSTGLGHGDAMHVSDMDPTNPGLEVWQIHEASGVPGADFRDAQTGEAILTTGTNSGEGPGRGVAADIDPNHLGYEMWASSSGPGFSMVFNTDGQPLYRVDAGTTTSGSDDLPMNFLVWWDANPIRELLDGTTISRWRYDLSTPRRDTVLSLSGSSSNNGSKANPSLSGDILGDWREEVIVRGNDNQSLRIYTTTIAATSRLFTLMHDTQYRSAMAWQNVAYNQPPHPSFFLGAGMVTPPQPKIFFGGELRGDYNVDGLVDAADWVMWQKLAGSNNLAADGDHDGMVDPGDSVVWQNNFGATASAGGSGAVVVVSAVADSPPVASSRGLVADPISSLARQAATSSFRERPASFVATSFNSAITRDLLLALAVPVAAIDQAVSFAMLDERSKLDSDSDDHSLEADFSVFDEFLFDGEFRRSFL